VKTRPPSAGRRGIRGLSGGLLARPRRATGNGRAPETGEEGWCAVMMGAALWRREFHRTPEACENALA
jgi:hypothetical protein